MGARSARVPGEEPAGASLAARKTADGQYLLQHPVVRSPGTTRPSATLLSSHCTPGRRVGARAPSPASHPAAGRLPAHSMRAAGAVLAANLAAPLAVLLVLACRRLLSWLSPASEPVPWTALPPAELIFLGRLLHQIQDDPGHNHRDRLLAWVLRQRLRLRRSGAARWDTISARCQRQLTGLLSAHALRPLNASDRRQLDRALLVTDLIGDGGPARRATLLEVRRGSHPCVGSVCGGRTVATLPPSLWRSNAVE